MVFLNVSFVNTNVPVGELSVSYRQRLWQRRTPGLESVPFS